MCQNPERSGNIPISPCTRYFPSSRSPALSSVRFLTLQCIPPPLSRSPKPPANPTNCTNHVYNMTRVVIYRNSSHVKTEMSSSDAPPAARCMKPSQTPARQEDTIGLSSFITHPCSQRSFIFNREQSRQEEMGSSALFPVIYKGRQPGLHRKQPGTRQWQQRAALRPH